MNLKDLKTGWRVKVRNGSTYVVLRDCETQHYGHQDVMFINFDGGFVIGSSYDDLNLINKNAFGCDIMQVYETHVNGFVFDKTRMGELVWERVEEPKDMTLSEIEDASGHPVRIVGDKA